MTAKTGMASLFDICDYVRLRRKVVEKMCSGWCMKTRFSSEISDMEMDVGNRSFSGSAKAVQVAEPGETFTSKKGARFTRIISHLSRESGGSVHMIGVYHSLEHKNRAIL